MKGLCPSGQSGPSTLHGHTCTQNSNSNSITSGDCQPYGICLLSSPFVEKWTEWGTAGVQVRAGGGLGKAERIHPLVAKRTGCQEVRREDTKWGGEPAISWALETGCTSQTKAAVLGKRKKVYRL